MGAMVRKTVSLRMDPELAKVLEEARSKERPIPSYSHMVITLLRKALDMEEKAQTQPEKPEKSD